MKCYICNTRLKKDDVFEVYIKDECGMVNNDTWQDTIVKVHDWCYEQDNDDVFEAVK